MLILNKVLERSRIIVNRIHENNNFDPGQFLHFQIGSKNLLIKSLCRKFIYLFYIIDERLLIKILDIKPTWGVHDQSIKILLLLELSTKAELLKLEYEKLVILYSKNEKIYCNTPFKFVSVDGNSYVHTSCWAWKALFELYKLNICSRDELNRFVKHLVYDYHYFQLQNGCLSVSYSDSSNSLRSVINVSADMLICLYQAQEYLCGQRCGDSELIIKIDYLISGLKRFVLTSMEGDILFPYEFRSSIKSNIDPYHSLMVLNCLVFMYVKKGDVSLRTMIILGADFIRNSLFTIGGNPKSSLIRKYPQDSYAFAELFNVLSLANGTDLENVLYIKFKDCLKAFKSSWVGTGQFYITKKYAFWKARNISFRWSQGYLAYSEMKYYKKFYVIKQN